MKKNFSQDGMDMGMEAKKYFRRQMRCNGANEFEHQSRKREIKKKKKKEVGEKAKKVREMGCPNEWVERVNDR